MFWIHTISGYISVVLGLTLNPLMFYLIVYHSIKEMQVYSKILLLTCIVDTFLSINFFTSQPCPVTIGKYRMLIPNGQLGEWISDVFGINDWWHCNTTMFGFLFSSTSLAVQFVYRYFAMCRSRPLSATQFFGLIAVSMIWVVIMEVLYYVVGYPPLIDHNLPEVKHVYEVVADIMGENRTRRLCVLVDGTNPWWAVLSGFEFSCTCLLFTIIGVCIYRIHRVHTNLLNKISDRKKAVDRQLALILMIQAILPFCGLFIPNIVNILLSMIDNAPHEITAYISLPVPWISVVNPFVTICIVKSYRRATLRMISYLGVPVRHFAKVSDSGNASSTAGSMATRS